jgi:hypothetical protein
MIPFVEFEWPKQLAAGLRRQMSNRLFAICSVLGFLLLSTNACSSAARQRTGTIVRAAAEGAAGASAPETLSKLMIFGGLDHKTYLGCLNCNEYASDSIFNSYGNSGSPYSSQSIWNHFSEYGSPYSTYSACNPFGSDPPVIVDQNGTFYGRLTLNEYHPQRGAGAKYHDWLNAKVCGNQ